MEVRFQLDIRTLSKLSFHAFIPAVVLHMLLTAEISGAEAGAILAFGLIHPLALLALCWPIFSIGRFRKARRVMGLGAIAYNTGNYGLPLALLAYGPSGMAAMAIVMVAQCLLYFTVGIVLLQERGASWGSTLGEFVRTPVIGAAALGFVLRALDCPLPVALAKPVEFLSQALVGAALLTLGAQMASGGAAARTDRAIVAATGAARLILSPLLALALLPLFGLSPLAARTMILAAAMPVAVTVFLLAREYERRPDLASRMVFWTTAASAASLPAILYWMSVDL